MSQLGRLRSATSRKELAEILGYRSSALTAIVYCTPDKEKYTVFEIEKKSGHKRTIKAPLPKLKKLQSHLSSLLYQCLEEIEENRQNRDVKPISFGFRRKRSIVDNAARHKNRRWVLNLDLEEFFPSFNFGRVRGFFLKDKAFELHPEVATTVAQIACDGRALPQGSPCSPVISELIAQILDVRLVRLAKKYRVTYSRYADDISFSTNQKEFPTELATPEMTAPESWNLGDRLVKQITRSGFSINSDKTRMHYRGSRQLVTGLVVNKKVNIRKEYYRCVRAMCHSLFQTGQYYKSHIPSANPDDEPMPDYMDNIQPLEGMLHFIFSVTQQRDEKTERNQQKKYDELRAIEKLYRRFLFYKYFVAPDFPLIVTEGKTDSIYIKAAVKSQTKFQPILGSKSKSGFQHNVRYINHHGSAQRILGLGGGGTPNMKSIILDYKRNLSKSTSGSMPICNQPMQHPVILLLDNDDGLGPIKNIIKNYFKVDISQNSSNNSFYFVTANLYVVKVPDSQSQEGCCIEDLFPEEWLKKELNGKKLNYKKDDINTESEYSKRLFAELIVRPNADRIDFSGFDPLLKRIQESIENYKTRVNGK